MGSHVHTWETQAGSPWMRRCACGAEGHLVGGVVQELGRASDGAAKKKGRK